VNHNSVLQKDGGDGGNGIVIVELYG
jgi:hypothetical protein